jgi:integrase
MVPGLPSVRGVIALVEVVAQRADAVRGQALHADTVTRRFNRLVVRRIRLHDVRHTYATLPLDSGGHAKIVSDRIGHAHAGISVQLYGHRSTGHDREAAELVATLIRTRLDAPRGDAG